MTALKYTKGQIDQNKRHQAYAKASTSSQQIVNPEIQTFVENYKTAYSHGLENIYTLENFDISSVRRINAIKPPEAIDKAELSSISLSPKDDSQLELPLGDHFKGTIEHFVLREPITVLGLTKHAEKCLAQYGK